VLEIDAEDRQQKALLKSLAGLGTAAAGATGPASSVGVSARPRVSIAVSASPPSAARAAAGDQT